jgi:hypothetical protein
LRAPCSSCCLTAVTTAGDAIKSEDDATEAALRVSKAAVNVDTGDSADEAAAEAAAGRSPPPFLSLSLSSSLWIRLVRIWSW